VSQSIFLIVVLLGLPLFLALSRIRAEDTIEGFQVGHLCHGPSYLLLPEVRRRDCSAVRRVRREVDLIEPAEIVRDLAVKASRFLGDIGRTDDSFAARRRPEPRRGPSRSAVSG
jgi:hypothetical protein